ncbi:aminodeoxychorismate/anthranilate synthase component II [soil metagenome]
MLLIIDNYDSFTYNLVQYFGEMGALMEIRRNDQVTVEEIAKLKPDHICISPGPCTPKEAGISNDVIKQFGASIPLLGVCLGHQCIGHVFGGDVVRAKRLMHGKVSRIHHTNQSVFKGMPEDFEATRYHSLIIEKDTFPDCLEITAYASDDATEIMGVRHKELPIHGVQFHPESILTQEGKKLLKNFLDM